MLLSPTQYRHILDSLSEGAFTDARADKPGRFALAAGGTLFLDEIGDTSPAMQVKLLRVLQERAYEPLGSLQPESCDVRVITATNQHLGKMVAEGEFRSDLYYRINVISFELPPLSEQRCRCCHCNRASTSES